MGKGGSEMATKKRKTKNDKCRGKANKKNGNTEKGKEKVG